MIVPEIHIWGDSLARGILYNEEKGRYAISHERCVTRLEDALGAKVVNHSNMGATVLDGLKWFEAFTPVPGALCAVEFGGNDCDLNWAYVAEHPQEQGQPKVALPAFEEGLTTFVHLIRAQGMRPILVTPLPLHAQRYFAWVTRGLNADNVLKALGDEYHIYRWQERYAIAVRNVALKTRCPLLDLRDAFLAQPDYEQLMCLDGIHPTDAGYRLLADTAIAMARRDLREVLPAAEREAAQAAVTAIPSSARVG
jgi:acyl-CoA thioesterase I